MQHEIEIVIVRPHCILLPHCLVIPIVFCSQIFVQEGNVCFILCTQCTNGLLLCCQQHSQEHFQMGHFESGLFVLSFILMNFHSCELKWFGIKLGFIFVLGLITSTAKKERKKIELMLLEQDPKEWYRKSSYMKRNRIVNLMGYISLKGIQERGNFFFLLGICFHMYFQSIASETFLSYEQY